MFFAWETYGCAHISTCCRWWHCPVFSYIVYQIDKLAKSNQVSSFALYRLRKNCNWFLLTSNFQVLWRTKIIGWRFINRWDSLCKYHLNVVHVLKGIFQSDDSLFPGILLRQMEPIMLTWLIYNVSFIQVCMYVNLEWLHPINWQKYVQRSHPWKSQYAFIQSLPSLPFCVWKGEGTAWYPNWIFPK